MSIFVPGGGTLKSTNKPAAFIELAHKLGAAELAASTDDLPINNISVSFDAEAASAAITATLPITAATGAGGSLTIQAANYVPAAAFDPGANGTLSAGSLPAAFLEMAQNLNAAEQAASTPDVPVTNITIALDLEGLTATVTAALPMATTTDAYGQVVIQPTDYL